VAIAGPSGDDGVVQLRFDGASCRRAIGTYEGTEGRWSRRSGAATIDADGAGGVLLGLYP
jgi:hypothetical protein